MEKEKMSPASKRSPRFLLLMQDDIREAIEREAFAHGRTVTKEINNRLRESLRLHITPGIAPSHITPSTTAHDAAPYLPAPGNQPLQPTDAAMLAIFRSLPPEKQLALLSLFK